MVFNVSARVISMEPSLVKNTEMGSFMGEKNSRREIPVLQSTVFKNQPHNMTGGTCK